MVFTKASCTGLGAAAHLHVTRHCGALRALHLHQLLGLNEVCNIALRRAANMRADGSRYAWCRRDPRPCTRRLASKCSKTAELVALNGATRRQMKSQAG